jgi:hypothetical protein
MKKILLLIVAAAVILAPTAAMAEGLALGTWAGAFPTLRYDFGAGAVDVGATYNSPNAGTATTAIFVKGEYKLAKLGNVQSAVGAYYMTNGVAAPGDVVVMGLTWGVTAMIESNLSVGADFVVANQTSVNGAATNTGILPLVAITAALYL